MYAGTNPGSGKPRYRAATVVGNRGDAERGPAKLVSSVRSVRSIRSASTVSEFMEAWFVVASGSWVPSTILETCAVVDPCRPDVVRYFDIAFVWVNGRFWFATLKRELFYRYRWDNATGPRSRIEAL